MAIGAVVATAIRLRMAVRGVQRSPCKTWLYEQCSAVWSCRGDRCGVARRRGPIRAPARKDRGCSAATTPSLDLPDRLRRAVGFRNVLVHDYVEVDDGIVIDRLGNLVDLDDFVAAVAGWVVPPRS